MQRLTRAQIIQFYEFASVEEVEQFARDAMSACQIVLEQQGINHPSLNPEILAGVEVVEVEAAASEETTGGPTDSQTVESSTPVSQIVSEEELAKIPLASETSTASAEVNVPSGKAMIGGFEADFPFAAKLVEGGINDLDALIKATDNEITFIPGIGPAALAKIRAAQAAQ